MSFLALFVEMKSPNLKEASCLRLSFCCVVTSVFRNRTERDGDYWESKAISFSVRASYEILHSCMMLSRLLVVHTFLST